MPIFERWFTFMKNSKISNKNNYSSTPCITPNVTRCFVSMSMLEVYQHMADDVAKAICTLRGATSSKEVRNILSQIYQYQVNPQVSESISHLIEDIKGRVHALHMNDYTRSRLCGDMEVLLDALHEAISAEEHKQDVADVYNVLQFMADHAEEFFEWLKLMQQKDATN